MRVRKEYKADISFLQPLIDGYKLGVFNDKGLPVSIMNALDSLSWYGKVRNYVDVSDRTVVIPHHKKYTKRSAYWNKTSNPPQSGQTEDTL